MRYLLLAICMFGFNALAAPPVEVLVLGTYHMGNPGQDLHNAEADDVLAPKRQREVADVASALARFKPTRVAVEWRADDQPGHKLPAFHDYLDGKRSDKRNEIDQIGFRLAKLMGHADVYGVDAAGAFPFEAVQTFAAQNGQAEQLQAGMDAIGSKVKQFEAEQRTQTIGQLLRSMNLPEAIAADHGWYMDALIYGAGANQPGADLVASWVTRNLQICARLAQIANPGDRIVVIYGAGHSHLLRRCVQEMPGWKLVEVNRYLPK